MAASPNHEAPARLPDGECNYRDLGLGTTAPTCGCNCFWIDESRHQLVVDVGDIRQTPWCICGHHACFHKDSKRSVAAALRAEKVAKGLNAQAQQATQDSGAVYVQYVRPTQDGRIQLLTSPPPTTPKKSRLADPGLQMHNTPTVIHDLPAKPTNSQQSGPSSQQAQQPRNTVPTQPLFTIPHTRPFSSPRPPAAIQRLDLSRPSSAGSQHLSTSSSQNRWRELPSNGERKCNAGLGLNFTLPSVASSLPSTTNSIQNGDLPDWARLLKEFNERPSSNNASVTGEGQRTSPGAVLQRVPHEMGQRRASLLPPVSTGYTFAYDRITEEQSATEVATPSNRGTPDLRAFENTINDIRESVDRQSSGATAAGPAGHQRSSPPNAFISSVQRLLPHLSAIQEYMASMPHENMEKRLEALENESFHHGSVDDLQTKGENLECHLISIEQKLDENTNAINAMQGDGSSKRRRLLPAGHEGANTSFASNSSALSTSSSTLIAAAIEREETGAKIKDVEERVSQLERTALPSFTHPLEIEVIFLPWGKDLKGIWFSPDNAPAASSALTTQESEEWTQAMNSNQIGPSLHNSGHSGWSSNDIHGWAVSTDEWLCARACAPRSVIYQRLRSRGFVRNIELKNSGARELQSVLKSAFSSFSQHFPLIGIDETSQPLEGSSPFASFLGLRRPLIPLRKIHKSSRLRFLSTSEMLTPAVWTAEFLSSSVIMHAQGGQKRLFVTNPEAYLQHTGDQGSDWTWQKLRELPRFTSPEVQSEAGVGEADAKEACWNYRPTCDPPPSLVSSFSSIVSSHPSRPSAYGSSHAPSQYPFPSFERNRHNQMRDESYMTKAGTSSQAPREYPPITPLSDISLRHRRTASAPTSEHSTTLLANTPTATKRRIISFDSAPHPRVALQLSRRTSGLSIQSGFSSKRRRISRSPEMERSAIAAAQGFTPRRSKEPPSPFYPPSSQGAALPRSQGHAAGGELTAAGPLTARGSYEPLAAYATPYSGGQMLQDEAMAMGEGDTEIDSAVVGDQEEVWEGVTEAEEPERQDEVTDHVETIEISSDNQNSGDFDFEDDSDGGDEDDARTNALDEEAVFDGLQFGY